MIADHDPFTDDDLSMVVAAPTPTMVKAKPRRFPAYRTTEDPGFGKAFAVPCPRCRRVVLRTLEVGLARDHEPQAIDVADEASLGVRTYSLKRFGALIFLTPRFRPQVGIDHRYPVLREHVCEEEA